MLNLDLINTVAFGGVVLFLGHGVRRLIPRAVAYNVPAPVIGGLLVALVMLAARSRGVTLATFDTRLQAPFMIAFFTTVGFGASVSLLKVGGPQVVLFLLLCDGARRCPERHRHPDRDPDGHAPAVRRPERVGDADRRPRDRPGVRAGVRGGGRAGRRDGRDRRGDGRHRLGWADRRAGRNDPDRALPAAAPAREAHHDPRLATQIVEDQIGERAASTPAGEDKESYALLKALVVILVAMWAGSSVSAWITVGRHHAARLHRRDAGGRGDPQRWTMRPA